VARDAQLPRGRGGCEGGEEEVKEEEERKKMEEERSH